MTQELQAERSIHLKIAGAPDILVPTSFLCTESVNQPFTIQMDTLCVDVPVDPFLFVGKPAAIKVKDSRGPVENWKDFHGIVMHGEVEKAEQAETAIYKLRIEPWLSWLQFSSVNRVFQNLCLTDILEEIFSQHGFKDFDFSALKRTYEPYEYKTQYNETNYDFIQRLLKSEGVSFYFSHQADKHTLFLIDDQSKMIPNAPEPTFTYEHPNESLPKLESFSHKRTFSSGQLKLWSHNYREPTQELKGELPLDQKTPKASDGLDETAFSTTHYMPRVLSTDASEHVGLAELQSRRVESIQFVARTEASFAEVGKVITVLTGSAIPEFQSNKYVVTEVMTQAQENSYSFSGGGSNTRFSVEMKGIPDNCALRQGLTRNAKPMMPPQTAVVVGPNNKPFTDQMGRVKVQFHWDEHGENNDKSSCFLRVSQLWSGNGMGSFFLPRPGTEVLVTFIDGNPDLPVIAGCLFDKNLATPYPLPQEQEKSGFRSQSIGGSTENYNEISFHDTSGEEKLYIRAEKDHEVLVQNDSLTDVKNDKVIKVAGNVTQTVGKDHTEDILGSDSRSVGKNLVVKVEGDVETNSTHYMLSVKGDATESVKGGKTVKADGEVVIESSQSLKFVCGGASIALSADGSIKISGTMIELNAPQIAAKGAIMHQ